ncbi:MAG: hypothetical protein WCS73_01555 [Lentisphaeria bacterium]
MNCQELQKKYLQSDGKIMTSEMQCHLDQCEECQEYVKVLKAIMPEETLEISKSLDAKVLQGYRLITKNRNRRKSYSWIMALASCFLLVCCVFALTHNGREKEVQSLTVNKVHSEKTFASKKMLASTTIENAELVAATDQTNPLIAEKLNTTETELENLELELDFLISSL